jgi:hypothetical protein
LPRSRFAPDARRSCGHERTQQLLNLLLLPREFTGEQRSLKYAVQFGLNGIVFGLTIEQGQVKVSNWEPEKSKAPSANTERA